MNTKRVRRTIILKPLHREQLMSAINCFISNLSNLEGIYISGAITTGTNFTDWYKERRLLIDNNDDYKKAHYKEIIRPNSDRILKYYNELSSEINNLIIEPASFEIPNWSQDDYLYYWGEIIKKCIIKIIFLDGWCYSKGCTFEYFTGLKKGIELVDQNQKPIEISWAIEQIKIAIAAYNKVGINTDLQQMILKEIEYECRKQH